MKKRLFALCIGINDYELADAPLLQKASHDAQALKAYLLSTAREHFHTVSVQHLIGAEATRYRIIQALGQHLGKVGAEDTALLYFSGIGTAERLSPSLQGLAAEAYLEGLLCHPPADDPGSDLVLLYREIDFLLREVAERCERVVRVFDCAHTTTRELPSNLSVKHWDLIHAARNWEDYAWGYSFSEKEALPFLRQQLTANQVTLHAAGNGLAFEDEEEVYSMFTKYMLSALHSTKGNISYANLAEAIQSAIGVRWRKAAIEQRITANSLDEKLLNLTFLR